MFIAGFLLISIVPEVAAYCSNLLSDDALSSCSREVVKASYIQSSFLSSSIVFLAFESQRFYYRRSNRWSVPSSMHHWLKAHAGMVLICLVTFAAYVVLSLSVQWLTGDGSEASELIQPMNLIKVSVIVFLSFYALTIYSGVKSRMDPMGKTLRIAAATHQEIAIGSIRYFTKKDRKYFVCTQKGSLLPIQLTLQDIERKIPVKYFARVNRSVIVRLDELESYNHWEHEKYILKLRTGETFTVTRKRLQILKKMKGWA